MGRPKRSVQAAAEDSINPPDELTATQTVARVVKAEGNNLYTCELPNKKTVVLELDPKFRNTIWLKRGGYVLIDVGSAEERKSGSRVVGEIINVVRDEKLWRKQPYWCVPARLKLPHVMLSSKRLMSLTGQRRSRSEATTRATTKTNPWWARCRPATPRRKRSMSRAT
jgi:probable RNA-binding protein EIF1AD